MAIVLGYNNCYCSFRGALAEELGKGLQNPVHECESRTRLHMSGTHGRVAELVYATDLKSVG